MYKISSILFIFVALSFFPIPSKSILEDTSLSNVSLNISEDASSSDASLNCPSVLNSSVDFKGMVLQLMPIINRVEVTQENGKILDDIRQVLLGFRYYQKGQKIELEKLLIVFSFFHVLPSVALSDSTLSLVDNIDKLKSRPYPLEASIQQLLIVINRHLRNYIIKLQSEYAISLDRPNFSLIDLAKEIHMQYHILRKIFSTDFVPNYSLMTQILNRGDHTIVTFFMEVENSSEFNVLFNNTDLGRELVDSSVVRTVIYTSRDKGTLHDIYMQYLRSRLPVLLEKLAPHISQSGINQLLEWPNITDIDIESVTLEQLLRLTHVFNKELSQVLISDDPSLLKPINLEKLHEMYIQIAFLQLSRNIRREMNISQRPCCTKI